MPKKHITSADLVIDHGDEIKELYEKGATVTRLVSKFGCARNTMTTTLIKLGFDGPEWTQKWIINQNRKDWNLKINERPVVNYRSLFKLARSLTAYAKGQNI